jgi:hypothetical protein
VLATPIPLVPHSLLLVWLMCDVVCKGDHRPLFKPKKAASSSPSPSATGASGDATATSASGGSGSSVEPSKAGGAGPDEPAVTLCAASLRRRLHSDVCAFVVAYMCEQNDSSVVLQGDDMKHIAEGNEEDGDDETITHNPNDSHAQNFDNDDPTKPDPNDKRKPAPYTVAPSQTGGSGDMNEPLLGKPTDQGCWYNHSQSPSLVDLSLLTSLLVCVFCLLLCSSSCVIL